jgi:DNA-binding transcriptional LysR family regulator
MANLPDFEAWAIFAKVADLGSFSRAATELGMSKATVSKAINRLETRLGTAVLHRTSRRLSLTETGRGALEHARQILIEGEAAEAESTERAAEPRGMVRLAAPLSLGIQALGTAIPAFLGQYPAVSVDLRLSDRQVDLVAEGIDVALRIGVLDDSTLRARQLYAIRRLLVAAPAYVAQHGAPTHPRELERHPALLFTQLAAPGLWHFRHPLEGECSVRVSGRFLVDNGDVAVPALIAGVGLAIAPEFLVWQALRDGHLVELLPDWTTAPTALHVVTPPGTLRPARVTALIGFLSQYFRHAPWAYRVPATD